MAKEFKMIPTDEEIQSLERDLRFHPVENKSPNQLSSAQVDHFNQQGYIAPISIFDEVEIGDIRDYFDDLLQREINPDCSRCVGVDQEKACFIGILLQVCDFDSSPTK
jgi:hypothetical protein